jgi:hypothetical protein
VVPPAAVVVVVVVVGGALAPNKPSSPSNDVTRLFEAAARCTVSPGRRPPLEVAPMPPMRVCIAMGVR